MYESFFLLSQRPFAPAPQAEVYIPTGSLEAARQTLTRCLERGEGPGLLIGPAGTGKSLLCQVLAGHFRGRFHVAQLASARLCTRRALLQNILFELKLPYRDMDEGELRLSLIDHLEPRAGGTDGLLLVVDEAHILPLRLLEEIRLLTNFVRDGQSRVRLVLAGAMALEERLASPKLESFHQRIAARCYLQSFGRDETIFYVQEQIRRAGGAADSLFSGEAQAAIHTATDGIPRLINQLCDHALLLAALGGQRQLDAAGIEEAWADLQQLPVPLHESLGFAAKAHGSVGSMVEFGQLDGELSAAEQSIGPDVGDCAVAALNQIGERIEALRGEEPRSGMISGTAADDFSPASASGTEVELIFHSAHDPFGGHWDEEEVVIDRYASLEDANLRNWHNAVTEEGRSIEAAVHAAMEPPEFAAAPNSLSRQRTIVPSPPPEDLGLDEPEPAITSTSADFHPASDPLLPDESPASSTARAPTISLGALGADDRDMIVVEDGPPPRITTDRPRRPEYRQLFSTLRGR